MSLWPGVNSVERMGQTVKGEINDLKAEPELKSNLNQLANQVLTKEPAELTLIKNTDNWVPVASKGLEKGVESIRRHIGNIAMKQFGIDSKKGNLKALKKEGTELMARAARDPALQPLLHHYKVLMNSDMPIPRCRQAVEDLYAFTMFDELTPETAKLLADLNEVALKCVNAHFDKTHPFPVDLIVNLARQRAPLEMLILLKGVSPTELFMAYRSLIGALFKEDTRDHALIQVKLGVVVRQLQSLTSQYPQLKGAVGPINTILIKEIQKRDPKSDMLTRFKESVNQINKTEVEPIKEEELTALTVLQKIQMRDLTGGFSSLGAYVKDFITKTALSFATKSWLLSQCLGKGGFQKLVMPSIDQIISILVQAVRAKMMPLLEMKRFTACFCYAFEDVANIDVKNPKNLPSVEDSKKKIAGHLVKFIKTGFEESKLLDVAAKNKGDEAGDEILKAMQSVELSLSGAKESLALPTGEAFVKVIKPILDRLGISKDIDVLLDDIKISIDLYGEQVVWLFIERLMAHMLDENLNVQKAPPLEKSVGRAIDTMRDLLIPSGKEGLVGKAAFRILEGSKKGLIGMLPDLIQGINLKIVSWLLGD